MFMAATSSHCPVRTKNGETSPLLKKLLSAFIDPERPPDTE